jgi:voltage-gated potassium channel
MNTLLHSPARNFILITLFLPVVIAAATVGYEIAGWSLQDSLYMVVLTVFTVRYGEAHSIDAPFLHALTMGTMIIGCTGMIFFTGARRCQQSCAADPYRC